MSNIYEKIIEIRKEFKDSPITKSGENKFQNFKYLELSDIIPTATDLCKEYGLYTHTDIGTPLNPNFATMTVINKDNIEEVVTYYLKIPLICEDAGFNGKIQDTGKMETYVRRYLYMLFLDIAVADEVDSADNRKSSKTTKSKRTKR